MDEMSKESCRAEFLFADSTDFCADSVEWCPFENYSSFLVCGTYQLKENDTRTDETQTREGNIVLYKLLIHNKEQIELEKQSTFNCCGVFDMKWCPKLIENEPHLAVACSDGQLLLLKLSIEDKLVFLTLVNSLALDISQEDEKKTSNMVLSLDWCCNDESALKIIASDSLGYLNYVAISENEMELRSRWMAHSFESWIAAFDYSQQHLVYSGGDDCRFQCWDTRNESTPIFVNKRHSMGVTAITKSKKNEHLLVTGSFDESVFLWDTRSMKSPVSEVSLGAGIWRLKWHPHNFNYLLSATMHNGFHVLSSSNSELKVIDHYTEHKSLAYGVDWCLVSDGFNKENLQEEHFTNEIENIVASCSFYDKLLHIWKIKI